MSRILQSAIFFCLFFFVLQSCKHKKDITEKVSPASMNEVVADHLKEILSGNASDYTDSLRFRTAVEQFYSTNNYTPIWSSEEKPLPMLDSFMQYLNGAVYDGLFKNDYNFKTLVEQQNKIRTDSVARSSAGLWVTTDLFFTNALMHVLYDLKYGRLVVDSASYKKNASFYDTTLASLTKQYLTTPGFTEEIKKIQPTNKAYWDLKKGITSFIDSMDLKSYTYLDLPIKDTIAFYKKLGTRLQEAGYNITLKDLKDSVSRSTVISKYQAAHHLTRDGKPGPELVNSLNNTDAVKLLRYAVTLDRYKSLPEKLPSKYIWVNLPSYYLKLWDNDTLVLKSKIICGKPNTSTPQLTSKITNMILYPTWTVPTSIIKKEMIPGLKRNPGYLAKKGLYLLNSKREKVDPYSINWSKYNNGIPFLVQQASGDNNALGVIKFNFNNPYSVYLHDTNQRYLFKNAKRALSHGCVRVEQWKELAYYIARNDSMTARNPAALTYNTDSINNWLDKGLLHKIDVKNSIPLYITYFGCEIVNGHVVFYDDIYNDDRDKINKYMNTRDFSLK